MAKWRVGASDAMADLAIVSLLLLAVAVHVGDFIGGCANFHSQPSAPPADPEEAKPINKVEGKPPASYGTLGDKPKEAQDRVIEYIAD